MAGLDQLHPVFADRLRRLSDAVGGLDWTSGYRSSARQKQLYDCWRARRPGCAPANPPGSSNHEAIPNGDAQGLAMDIGRRNRDAARRRGREFGVHFPIAGEPWHVQPVECQSPKFTGVPNFGGGSHVHPSPSPSPSPSGPRVLRKGDRGGDVADWQRTLGIPDDGVFGPQTEEATKRFQREHGLVDDGVVGPRTRQAAQAPTAPAPPPPPPAPSSFRVIPKAEWGAASPRGEMASLALPVKEFWIHHTVSQATDDVFADARKVQEVAFSRGFDDTSYCYLVHPNGMVLEGRGLTVGAHTKGRNSISIGLAFIGNLSEVEPTPAAMEGARWLQGHLVNTGALDLGYGIRGHRDNPESPSECPGNHLYPRLGELGKDPSVAMPGPSAPPAPPNNEEIIMALPVVRQGDKGQHVSNVQGLLNANGQSVAIDGDFGPGTQRGLSAWQGRAGLGADGVVGPKTWRALLSV